MTGEAGLKLQTAVENLRTFICGVFAFSAPTLSATVRSIERTCWRDNPVLSAHRYTAFRRLLIALGHRPLLAASAPLVVYMAATVAVFLTNPAVVGLRAPVGDYFRDLQAINAGVLGAQSTLVGVVYPIVIALAGLLFEARATTGRGLGVFLRETEALVTGASALALCGVVSIAMLVGSQLPVKVLFAITSLNSVWFIGNLIMITFFLKRSFDYMPA
jgi:hypothetical protein